MRVTGLSMRCQDQLSIFDFDGSANLRSLNRHAAELYQASRGGLASPFDADVLNALRDAARRCQVEGHARMDLALGVPRRAFSLHLTPSVEPSHFLVTAVECAANSRDELSSESAAAIAHHIRNPMAGIRGAVEVIGAELVRDEADLLGIVRQITARIDDLDHSLDAMLGYLHAPSPERRLIELKALLERALAEEARPVHLRGLDIRLRADEVVLAADTKQLIRTMLDLLTNCAEALPAGRGSVEVTLSKDARCATIMVTDAPGLREVVASAEVLSS